MFAYYCLKAFAGQETKTVIVYIREVLHFLVFVVLPIVSLFLSFGNNLNVHTYVVSYVIMFKRKII